ncbi:MAG: hypothetical protein K2P45_05825 [Eubacterium sp.]|nr:hypothetical protein [Eubacterium sp.]
MYKNSLYFHYVFRLKQYFLSGLSKVLDIWNFNQIDYPSFLTDEEALSFDAREIEKDFAIVGKDLWRAFDSYGKKCTERN